MSTEANTRLDITKIREEKLAEGYVTSQNYHAIRPDTASHFDTRAEILRRIGPGFNMIAVIHETIHFDYRLGGGSDGGSERIEEWDDTMLNYYFNEFTLVKPLKDPRPLSELVNPSK
ncbi:MAG: hypothetical protein PHQ59_05515 [Candidatus Daviesbacteria bacterium]|nr:hypothetical protein [Candidatus Daviesbacteria bacterium]